MVTDGVLRLNTTGKNRIASLHMDNHYITLRFHELHYLLNMFHVQNQLNSYIAALPDVMTCDFTTEFNCIRRTSS